MELKSDRPLFGPKKLSENKPMKCFWQLNSLCIIYNDEQFFLKSLPFPLKIVNTAQL